MIYDPYQLLVIGANLLFREGSIGKTPLYVNEERSTKRGVRCRLLSSVNSVYYGLKESIFDMNSVLFVTGSKKEIIQLILTLFEKINISP